MECNGLSIYRCVSLLFAAECRLIMLALMADKPTEAKVIVQARVDANDIKRLDALSDQEGTVHYRRSRSELIGFAVREYIERHAPVKKTGSR